MIIDAHSLPNNKATETDVCIVGAGPAGMTLAREFIGQPFRVCVLESGGLEPEKEIQSLAWGENIGLPYYPLDTARSRCFGGSPYRWLLEIGDNRIGARLRPLDEIDFEERDWIPYSGWPFNKAHLDPYYERAQVICQSGPFTYKVEDWENPESTPRLPLLNGRVTTAMFHLIPRDAFVRDYVDELRRAENVSTYLHATVVEVETAETAQSVSRLRVTGLHRKTFWVSAKLFILALGGIETPRLLLLSNKTHHTGLGNQNDLVGRFFMEHPHLWSGFYIPSNPDMFNSTGLYTLHTINRVPIEGKLTISEEVLRHEKLLNYCVSIHPSALISLPSIRKPAATGVHRVQQICSAVRRGDIPDFNRHLSTLFPVVNEFSIAIYRRLMRVFNKFVMLRKFEVFRLNHQAEQEPNPNSRITLSDKRDALGQNHVRLDWQVSPRDIRSMIRAQEIIDQELRRAGLGRLEIELHDDTPPPDLHGGWHHMGTTRMHVNPKMGVVNENCQVHGVSNLFIAGPSVFPTGGYANPVLTIVALAARLADHVKKLMTLNITKYDI